MSMTGPFLYFYGPWVMKLSQHVTSQVNFLFNLKGNQTEGQNCSNFHSSQLSNLLKRSPLLMRIISISCCLFRSISYDHFTTYYW